MMHLSAYRNYQAVIILTINEICREYLQAE